MSGWRLLTWFAALGNSLLYALVYRDFLNPVYPHWFDIVPRSAGEFAFTLIASLLPLPARSRALSAASALALLVYVLYFVPSIWQLHYGLAREGHEAMTLQAILAGCMAALFLASREWFRVTIRAPRLRPLALLAAIAAMILAIAWSYRSTMRLVGFDDVYELRFASADAGVPAFIGYLTMWCTYCFVPYCIARGLHCRDLAALVVGAGGCLVIYMATGAKSAILAPVILGGLFVVMRSGRHPVGKLLLAMIAAAMFLLWVLPEGAMFDWARSVYFMRTMGSSGWTTQVYYEFFSTHGYTYYSHLGFIDAVTGDYAAYRPYILGQLIGIEVAGSEQSNFNAGFWGSDGLAAFGAAGLPIATLLVAGYFVVLNIAANGVDRRFAALWASGFGMALLNLPFGTAMLSGGGLLLLLLLIFVKVPDRTATAVSGAARSTQGPSSS
jgi:hypothetical protein